MKVVTYRITLLEPALVTEMSRDPNSDVAAPYLPGTALRGAIIGKYIQQERRANPTYELKADGTNERRLFFDNQTRFLNGYLSLKNKRSLPTPRSWHQEKHDVAVQSDVWRAEVFDFAVDERQTLEQPQGIGASFFLPFSNGSLVAPRRSLTVHTARTRRFGRAVSPTNNSSFDKNKGDTVGAVYRYDSLASNQTFAAAILCEDDSDAATLATLLKGVNENREETLLGGSRTGGYGLALFHHIDTVNSDEWHEYESFGDDIDDPDVSSTPVNTKREIAITFLSDVLVRDANGQPVVDEEAVRQAIIDKLPGVSLTPLKERIFMRGRVVGGFNRKWGLPLPQTLVIQMGSVFVFEADNLAEKSLTVLLWQGIGERRTEGFGRIAVDWHSRSSFTPGAPPPRESEPRLTLEGESKTTAQEMAARLLRKKLGEQLIAKAGEITLHNPPHNSQLARMRNVIHAQLMSNAPSLARVQEYLADIKKRTTARKQFEDASHGSDSLVIWLETHLKFEKPDDAETMRKFEELFDLSGSAYKPTVGGEVALLTTEMCREYMLRFIDAVLARAAKDKRKEN
jgi:CRISPR-associated protein Csx10